MFVITHPYTSKSYSLFYNKSIIIYDTDTQTYHKFDPATQTYSTPKPSECKGIYTSAIPYTISELVAHRFNYTSHGLTKAFSSLEEATLAKLHLLSQLAIEVANNLVDLQAKYTEACPPSLFSSYDTLKLNYPEIFI